MVHPNSYGPPAKTRRPDRDADNDQPPIVSAVYDQLYSTQFPEELRVRYTGSVLGFVVEYRDKLVVHEGRHSYVINKRPKG